MGRMAGSERAPVTVVLGEDNYLVREGVERLLEATGAVRVLACRAELHSLKEAIDQLVPDVVVTDIRMPPTGLDEGVQIARWARDAHPEMGVLILSQYSDPALSVALLERGVAGRGYLLKDRVRDIDEFIAAIRTVAEGGSVIDPQVVEDMVAADRRRASSLLGELTAREREVLSLMAQGMRNGAIARALVITENSVQKYVNAIFGKLGLSGEGDDDRRVRAVLMFLSEHGHRPATPAAR
jgi:DNA-binding NarL/FixJ family response regulator